MHCPYCGATDTKVVDSRLVADGLQVKRRRACTHPDCLERFTTFERAELAMPKVIKRDNSREPFSEGKVRAGLQKACEKRPISAEVFEQMVQKILHAVRAVGEREVPASDIGDQVMAVLREVDQVAFVRFASVYRSFEDIDEFQEAISRLQDPKETS